MSLKNEVFPKKNLAHDSGFTLLELLITITIAAVLAGIAIPSFKSSISGNRLTTYTNDMVTALNLARSEAVKRGKRVVVRRIGADWQGGWRVFIDENNDDAYTTTGSNPDTQLRSYTSIPTAISLTGNTNFVDFVRYMPSGQTSADGIFVLCDSGAIAGAKMVIVNPVGRVQIGSDADHDNIPENAGTEITSCTTGF
jgi:type IV fimbrial biogenesis protein FimT